MEERERETHRISGCHSLVDIIMLRMGFDASRKGSEPTPSQLPDVATLDPYGPYYHLSKGDVGTLADILLSDGNSESAGISNERKPLPKYCLQYEI